MEITIGFAIYCLHLRNKTTKEIIFMKHNFFHAGQELKPLTQSQ